MPAAKNSLDPIETARFDTEKKASEPNPDHATGSQNREWAAGDHELGRTAPTVETYSGGESPQVGDRSADTGLEDSVPVHNHGPEPERQPVSRLRKGRAGL